MNRRRVQLFSLAGLLLSLSSVALVARLTHAAQETAPPNLFANDNALRDLINYRRWTRANEKPLEVTLTIGALPVMNLPIAV